MGTLKLALDEADQRGWTVVSMKDDWKAIFAPRVTLRWSVGADQRSLKSATWTLPSVEPQLEPEAARGVLRVFQLYW